MSDIKESGFKSSEMLASLAQVLSGLSDKEKKAEINKAKAIFEFKVKNDADKEQSWLIDLKKDAIVTKGKGVAKPDVTIILSDVLCDLADDKISAQKAFMTGKLKTQGNMMLALKLEGVLKMAREKAKL
ncbi:hypothetical protein FRC03_006688 [Tulasnella sp. 419]|nr:hypothetical protein FRC02_007880 [Tulasnella sp. 418]KAG8970559.1 hypothetical protein FRC03_006688 [Tulasnella sp. 419]